MTWPPGVLRWVKLWLIRNLAAKPFDLGQENPHNSGGNYSQRLHPCNNKNKVSAEEGIRMKLPVALGKALSALSAFFLRAGTPR